MAKSFLSPPQRRFLEFFAGQLQLTKRFYLTGGTALSEFYLHHRISLDLDFFSFEEFTPQDISIFIKKGKEKVGYKSVDFQQAFNRNIYQLVFPKKDFLKVEFTYFPFPQIEPPGKVDGMKIDSLLDIAVNKVFTIYQSPRGRDFFDLYFIHKVKGWGLVNLFPKAKVKFDFHIDLVQLGSQLLKVKETLDDPIVPNKDETKMVEGFILEEAKKLEKLVFKR